MKKTRTPRAARVRRHTRVRDGIAGTPERPRLAVYRSLNHIYAQIIDDTVGYTLAHASDEAKALKTAGKKKSEVAGLVGEALAKMAKEKGIEKVVFDRGGFRYHGRVKALAEAARKGGLSF